MGRGAVENTAVLHALAEPNRTAIMRLLVDHQLAVKDLVRTTGLSQPLVSHHLKVLRESQLVESTVCAGMTVYRVRAATLKLLADRLMHMADTAAVTSSTKPC